MRKFSSKKEQLEWADRLLRQLAEVNTGGVTPIIKQMINDNYIRRVDGKRKTYDVIISYPIKVGAESKNHVKEIIMANELLRNAADLKLKITEVKGEKK